MNVIDILTELSKTESGEYTTVLQLGQRLKIPAQDDNKWNALSREICSLISDRRVQIAREDEYIYRNYLQDGRITPFQQLNLYMSSEGLAFLNQVEMKKAIEKFNLSSDRLALILIILTLVVAVFAILTYIK